MSMFEDGINFKVLNKSNDSKDQDDLGVGEFDPTEEGNDMED